MGQTQSLALKKRVKKKRFKCPKQPVIGNVIIRVRQDGLSDSQPWIFMTVDNWIQVSFNDASCARNAFEVTNSCIHPHVK